MRPRRTTGLAALVACAISLASAQVGWAAITGAELAAGSTASPSSFSAAVTARCAAGKRALGAGYGVTGIGPVLLDDLRPLPGLDGFRVQGVEEETGFDSNWDVVAFMTCAHPVPGLELVSTSGAIDSSNKESVARCPVGKRVVGLGADINAGNGQVILDAMTPAPDLTSVTVRAVEDQTGFAGNWGLTAHAICAEPVGGLTLVRLDRLLDSSSSNRFAPLSCGSGRAVLAVGGDFEGTGGEIRAHLMSANDLAEAVFILSEDADGASGDWAFQGSVLCANASTLERPATAPSTFNKGVTATCPAGKSVFGGGGEVTGGPGEVAIRNIAPAAGLGSLRVEAAEDETDSDAEWSLASSTICSTTPAGLELVSSTSAANSATKTATATCPAGKRVLGGGAGVSAANGQVLLDDLEYNAGLTAVTAKAVEDGNGYAETWTVRADAMCAAPVPGLERVAASSALTSEGKSVTATCPGLKNLVGLGGNINGGVGQVGITGLSADTRLQSVTFRAGEDQNGYSAPWGLTAIAVCASP